MRRSPRSRCTATTSAGPCGRCGNPTPPAGGNEPRRWPPRYPLTCGPWTNGSPCRPCNSSKTPPKFRHYQQIPSLREYVLVSQDEPVCERFVRQPDGSWVLTPVTGLG